jgi:hypothetical protein
VACTVLNTSYVLTQLILTLTKKYYIYYYYFQSADAETKSIEARLDNYKGFTHRQFVSSNSVLEVNATLPPQWLEYEGLDLTRHLTDHKSTKETSKFSFAFNCLFILFSIYTVVSHYKSNHMSI